MFDVELLFSCAAETFQEIRHDGVVEAYDGYLFALAGADDGRGVCRERPLSWGGKAANGMAQ